MPPIADAVLLILDRIPENKSYLEESTKQDAELNERLKNVYVTSSDAIPEPQSANDSKPLPVKRTTEYFELGYKESKFVPSGRVSLMQAMKFINDHRMNASEWTIAKIADDNKIKEDVAGRWTKGSVEPTATLI